MLHCLVQFHMLLWHNALIQWAFRLLMRPFERNQRDFFIQSRTTFPSEAAGDEQT